MGWYPLWNVYNVVIIGAGQVGVEIGLWLQDLGRKVTIVEATDKFMPAAHYSDAEHAMALFAFKKSEVILKARVKKIEKDFVEILDENGMLSRMKADTTVMATGFIRIDEMYNVMRETFPVVYNIGDSVKARNVFYAIHEAYEIASHI